MKKYIFAAVVAILILAGFTQRVVLRDIATNLLKPPVPVAETYAEVKKTATTTTALPLPTNTATKPTNSLPAKQTTNTAPAPTNSPESTAQQPVAAPRQEINLAVPFQPQAPFGNWVLPYKEACEEASLIMVDYYLRGAALSAQKMSDEIIRLVAWEDAHGYQVDVSIPEVREIAEALYEYQVLVLEPLTPETIREQLRLGRAVIVPVAGRELGNPYFTPPGPFYHMLVIKGYTKDGRFITNDPGTRRGADYIYSESILMSAIRDWDGDSPSGPVNGLVMYK